MTSHICRTSLAHVDINQRRAPTDVEHTRVYVSPHGAVIRDMSTKVPVINHLVHMFVLLC